VSAVPTAVSAVPISVAEAARLLVVTPSNELSS
jgi:hypothetical protein